MLGPSVEDTGLLGVGFGDCVVAGVVLDIRIGVVACSFPIVVIFCVDVV